MLAMAEAAKTSDKAETTGAGKGMEILLSVPLKVASKQDAGTGDERRFSINFQADTAETEGVHTLFVNGTVDGDTADRLELAGEYVLEVRRA